MPPIRVLRVIADLQFGGVQRMMLRTLRGLRERGVESEVVCQKSRGELAEQYEAEGFRVRLIRFNRRLDPGPLLRLRRLGLADGFDVVHAHQYQSNLAANLAFLGCRRPAIVNTYHSIRPVHSRSQALQVRLTRRAPAAFVAVSEAVRRPLLELGVPEARTEIIYNGVPVPEAPPPLPDRADGDPLELVYAGRFVKQKRLDVLVANLKRCVERGVALRATLVGDGPVMQRTRRAVAEAGLEDVIEMPGFTNDVPARLARAELYVTASEREGFANALLECCAAGRPFAASDIPPHREMKGESDAGLVLPDDPDAWADALGRLASDRARLRAMSRAAFERVQAFSEDETVRRLETLYRRALAAR